MFNSRPLYTKVKCYGPAPQRGVEISGLQVGDALPTVDGGSSHNAVEALFGGSQWSCVLNLRCLIASG